MGSLESTAEPNESVPPSNGRGESGDLDELKGHFLASLNHEIRTPLSGILGMTDLLLETGLDDEQREYVDTARVCAQELLETLNATLEFAALASGRVVLEEGEFSISELFESALGQHAAAAAEKGLNLAYSIDGNVPQTLMGDGPRVRQLLGHLVANAVKFTSRGRVDIRARLERGANPGERLAIDVRDTGIGIGPENLGTIFESFHQVDRGLARRYAGLGLGLALAQKLSSLMGGAISVTSSAGVGSTFTVVLPLRKAHEERAVERAAHPERTARILVVEDNPVGQAVVRHILQRGGLRVDLVQTGREAIEAAEGSHYDLILMDLQIPEVDGLEAAAAIRSLEGCRNIPIVALTASPSDELRDACHRRGMQAFLSKPVQPDELMATVRRFL